VQAPKALMNDSLNKYFDENESFVSLLNVLATYIRRDS
jgi:hypothetical protein